MPDEVNFEEESSPNRAGITGVSPIAAGLAGDITVTVSGSGFDEKPDIYFGSSLATDFVFESSKTLQVQLPAATQAFLRFCGPPINTIHLRPAPTPFHRRESGPGSQYRRLALLPCIS